MKFCLIFLSIFFSCYHLLAQQFTFQKKIGGPNRECAYAIQKTIDTGYIVGGITSSYGAGGGSFDLYLVKLNIKGDTVWTRTYGGGCAGPEGISDIYPAQDSGFILTGYTSCWTTGSPVTDVDAYIIRIKGNGDTVWTKHWGGVGEDIGNSIIEDNAGNIVVTGSESSFGAGMSDIFLTKLNGNGDTIWNRTFGGVLDDWGYSVIQTKDGGYAIGGSTKSFGFSNKDIYLVKTDVNGNLLWSKTYGGGNDDEIYQHGLQQTSDGGFVLVGSTNSFGAGGEDIYFVKTDSLGMYPFYKTFGGIKDEVGYVVRQTKDNGYIITGLTKSFGFGGDSCNNAFLLKIDMIENIQWAHTYGGNGKASTGSNSADGAYGLVIADDGGYVICGLTNSWGANANDEDMYIIKTDSLGNSNCTSQKNTSFISAIASTSVVGIPATKVFGGGNTYSTGTIVSSGGKDSFMCNNATHIFVNNETGVIGIRLYPNPAKSSFTLNFSSLKPERISVNVFDQLGRTLCNFYTEIEPGENKINIDTKTWSRGLYFVKIAAGFEDRILKIALE